MRAHILRASALAGFVILGSITAFPFQEPVGDRLTDFDGRAAQRGALATAPSEQQAAVATLRARLPKARVDLDQITGAPRMVSVQDGFLTGSNGQGRAVSAAAAAMIAADDPHRPVKTFLQEHRDLFGHGPEALNQTRVIRDYVTPHNGMRTVAWQQEVDGIPVFESILVAHTTRRGELINVSSGFVPAPNAAANAGSSNRAAVVARPPLSSHSAVVAAARNVGETITEGEVEAMEGLPEGAERKQKFQAQPLLGETTASLVWVPVGRDELRLSWDVILTSRLRGEMFRVLVDARNGEVILRRGLTRYISDASYRVYTSDSPSPFSPGHSTPLSTQPPLTSRTLLTLPALNTNASPNGWINDGANETTGNNVDAHTDRDNNNSPDLPRPAGSPFRVFDFAMNLTTQDPTNYMPASVVQLFYLCNWYHDKLYEFGFTEAAGNFQINNFGRGGFGNDPVQADAQDGGGVNNANFSTPPDGSPGRMQMYIFNGPNPRRDGDLDAEIVFHEYTHGLSWRLVGGGQGLGTSQSDGMGEGWSDFYPLALFSEPGDNLNGCYAAGGYATYLLSGLTANYYYGIRRYPYSTDMAKNPLTFKDIDTFQASPHTGIPRSPIIGNTPSEVHNQGEVWCVALWEARANLIGKHGWAVGNQLILQLVTDGMKLTPPAPNFLQARDAILQADLVNTGGANRNELWAAFAKRGMGYSATSPASTSNTGIVEAYDVPDDLFVTPTLILTSGGPVGGPFSPNPASFILTNTGSTTLNWSLSSTSTWITVQPTSGTLPPGAAAVSVDVTIGAVANTYPLGAYNAGLTFTNHTSGVSQARTFRLSVVGGSMFDDFDPDLDLTQWSAFGGVVGSTVRATNSGGFVSPPNSLWFGASGSRFATTVPIDASGGGSVSFWLRLGNGSSPWETVDLPGEGVVLEYSVNGGSTWATIVTCNTSTFYNWTQVSNSIPVGARSNNTLFRWRQLSNSGTGFDHWALDDVTVDAGPASTLALSIPATATEGDAPLTGTVTVSPAPASDLTVGLNSSDPSEASVPASVVISAGNSNATFDIVIQDDAALDGSQTATIAASAAAHQGASAVITVGDNETATLAVTLPVSTTESAGTIVGTVGVSTPPAANIVVGLGSSDTSEIQVPASVVLLTGQTSAVFNVTVVNDSLIDGSQVASVTAQVPNWTDGVGDITVLDDETVNLTVSLPASAYENVGLLAGAGQVRLSGSLPTNLVVSLASSDLTEATVPVSTTVFAGQTNAAFDITTVDDMFVDGVRLVQIVASGNGFINGTNAMSVLDDESPVMPSNPNPANLASNVVANTSLSWSNGFAGVTNDVYFGTTPGAGQLQFLGSTTGSSWPLPLLAPNTTYYWRIVVRRIGTTIGPLWRFTTRGVDHFEVSNVASPQFVSTPFSTTITAKDEFGTTVSNFTGSVTVSGVAGGSLSGIASILFFENVNNHYVRTALDELGLAYQLFGGGSESAFYTAVANANPSNTLVVVDNASSTLSVPTSMISFINAGGRMVLNYWDLDGVPTLAAAFDASLAGEMTTPLPVYDWGGSQLFAGLPNPVNFVETSWGDDGDRLNPITGGTAVGGFTVGTNSSQAALIIGNAGRTILNGFLFDNAQPGSNAVRLAKNEIQAMVGYGAFLAITPTNASGFVNGSWTGDTAVLQPATNVTLQVDDGGGHLGASNPFDVLLRNDISVTVADSPDPISVGGNLTYAITVTNIGPASAADVTVTNILPASTTIVSVSPSQGTVTTNGNVLVCSLGSMAGNASAAVVIVVTVNSTGSLSDLATVARSDGDAYLPNNTSLAMTAVQSPVITISDATLYEGNAGTAATAFVVTVTPAPAAPVSVNFTTVSGSAVAPGDFIGTNGVLNFAVGQTSKTIPVVIVGDTFHELDETFTLNLSGAVNASLADNQAVGTIRNDDAMPTLSIGDMYLVEGNAGATNAVFPVTLSAASGLSVTVNYATANGNATSGVDYVARSGSLTIPAGATTNSVAITINGDLQIESDEVFYVDLTSAANAILLKREGVGLILNDDGLPGEVHHLQWSALAPTQYVGMPFSATITALDYFDVPATNFNGIVNLNAMAGGVQSTNFILGNPTYSSSASGNWTLGYSFTPGTNLTVTHLRRYFGTKISIWTDTGILLASQNVTGANGVWTETALTNALELQAGTRYRVAAYTGGGTYYYRTDGSYTFPYGAINLGYEISGDAFPTSLSSTSTRWWFVDLRYTVGVSQPAPISPPVAGPFINGSWTGDVTVLAASTNLVLLADDGNGHTGLSAPMRVELRNDIALSIADTPDPVAVGANVSYLITVTNVGPAAATGVVVTNLLPATAAFVSAALSQGSASTNGNAVVCQLGTLAGNSVATITIVATTTVNGTVTNVATVYRTETDPLLANNSAMVTTSVQIPALFVNSVNVPEGNSGTKPLVFTVALSVPAVTNVSVSFATANGSATAGSDYIATNGILSFNPGQTNLSFSVQIIGDTISEPNEAFTVALANATNAIIGGAVGTGTILNDENTGIIAYFTDNNSGAIGWSGPITNAGFIPLRIADIATFALTNIDVLVIDEQNNSALSSALLARLPAIQSWVNGGGKLVIHDRSTGNLNPSPFLLGTSGITTARFETADVDVIPPATNLVVAGPRGTINNTTLDGGTSSAHGYIPQAQLPNGGYPIISMGGSPANVVCFSYPLGNGLIYYSSIPLDYYLAGNGPAALVAALTNIYAPNVLAYITGQAGGNPTPPTIVTQPTSQTAVVGGTATFTVGAVGSFPLNYRWRKGSVALTGATNASLVLSGVQTNDAGYYSVVVTNSYNSVTSDVVSLTVVDLPASGEFRIVALTTNNSAVAEHDTLTGDDRGGIAASSSQLFYSGDSATARFSLANLSGGVSIGRVNDGMVSDLRTEQMYHLANGTNLLAGAGTVTTLVELSGATGLPTGNVIPLSTPVAMSYGSGIFAGYGRIALHNGTRVYEVLLPSGQVVDRGAMTMPSHMGTENWAFWGVVENYNASLYLVYVQHSQAIARTLVPSGVTTTLATFSNLSDMACITASITRNRWYFHYEGSGQFGGASETIGYADAAFSLTGTTNPPAILTQPVSQTVGVGGPATLSVVAFGAAPMHYQWRRNGAPIGAATNSGYTMNPVQYTNAGIYSVVVSNAYGYTNSADATLTVVPFVTNLAFYAFDTGWYNSAGDHSPGNANYIVGDADATNYRDWFAFSIPPLAGRVTAASLRLNTYGIVAVGGFETYRVRHVSTPVSTLVAGGTGLVAIYNDLGDGVVYGSRDFLPAEASQFITMTLNADFMTNLTAAAGQTFAMGGEIASLDGNLATAEYVFGSSLGNTTDVQLILTVGSDPSPLRFVSSEIAGGTLYFWLGTADGSPILPDRAAGIHFYSAPDVAQPMTNWVQMTNSVLLTNDMLRLSVPGPLGSSLFIRASEGP